MEQEYQLSYIRLAVMVLMGLWAPLLWITTLSVVQGGFVLDKYVLLTALHPLYGLLPMALLWIAGTATTYTSWRWSGNSVERVTILLVISIMHLGLAGLIGIVGTFLAMGT